MFRRRSRLQKHREWRGPADKRAYAIGDVHGCFEPLKQLIAAIEADISRRDEKQTYLVFLGDLIDRGAASRDVVEYLLQTPPAFATPVFIKGNHEESLVRALSGEPNLLRPWLEHGGYACAASYGVPAHALSGQSEAAMEHALLSALPRAHIDFLRDFVDSASFGDYLFVHAGIRPGVAIEKQSARDMRWIRHAFLESRERFEQCVVHGHTISPEVEILENRIGVDTGAYAGGPLSCVRLEDDEVAILSVLAGTQTRSGP